MGRKKKGSEAPDLFENLMDDLANEDSNVMDLPEETGAKQVTGFLRVGRSDEEKEKEFKATNFMNPETRPITRSGAKVWDELKESVPSEDSNASVVEFKLKPQEAVTPSENSEVHTSATSVEDATVQSFSHSDIDDSTVAVSQESTVGVGRMKRKDESQVVDTQTATRYGDEDKVVMSMVNIDRDFKSHVNQDASLAQAHALQIAQDKILSLEKEVDKLRQENDDLAMAANVMRQRSEELQGRVESVEREKVDVYDQGQSELVLVKGQLNYKDIELNKARQKVEDLESRLRTDFKKIRVKERELENRLEIVKTEKQALLRAKDEQILELQRKIDHLKSELDHHRTKVQDMFKATEAKKDQMRKAIKALRLALTHLEAQGEDLAPTRKRE